MNTPGGHTPFDLRNAPAMLARVAILYDAMLAQHGATDAGVGWSEGSQAIRFEVLGRLVAGQSGPIEIGDLGSGYGAFFGYLATRSDIDLAAYDGYEICEEMVAAAQRRIVDSRARFHQSLAVTRPADFCFASGTYNIMPADGAPDWTGYIRESLKNMARMSRIGFAFNMLHPQAGGDPAIFRSDPQPFADFCRGTIGGEVRLIRDYGLAEWTLFVTRPQGSRSPRTSSSSSASLPLSMKLAPPFRS